MVKILRLTAIIEREGKGYVATCPELDVVSQGETIEDARRNLLEAVEGFFEVASPSEIKRRLKKETYIMPIMQKAEGESTITVPVPDHKELKMDTLSGIIRQSGLPRSLFEIR